MKRREINSVNTIKLFTMYVHIQFNYTESLYICMYSINLALKSK